MAVLSVAGGNEPEMLCRNVVQRLYAPVDDKPQRLPSSKHLEERLVLRVLCRHNTRCGLVHFGQSGSTGSFKLCLLGEPCLAGGGLVLTTRHGAGGGPGD